MTGYDNDIGTGSGEVMQVGDGTAHGARIINKQVGYAGGRTVFANRLPQPASIGGEEDAPTCSTRQQTHLPASMARKLYEQQRPIAK